MFEDTRFAIRKGPIEPYLQLVEIAKQIYLLGSQNTWRDH